MKICSFVQIFSSTNLNEVKTEVMISLTPLQKKITILVMVLFSVMAIYYSISNYLKFKKIEQKQENINGNHIKKELDGTIVEGYFVNGQLNGKGKKTTLLGEKIEGEFINDELCSGSIISNDRIRIGQFKNGKLNGIGKEVYNGCIWEGTFEDGELSGKGKVTLTPSDILEGEFKHGILIDEKSIFDQLPKI